MYLLYLDESGNEDDPADKYFVLGGIAFHERQTYYVSRELEGVQAKHFPGAPPIPFHALDIRTGSKFWRQVDKDVREAVVRDVLDVLARSGGILFGAAIEKSSELWGENAVKRATEEICRRFDVFLMKKFHEENDAQRGLLIFSEGRIDQRAKVWVRGFRELGTGWGVLHNLSDIPYFASAKETRLLQAADFVAYAIFLLYERRDNRLIRRIIGRFSTGDGTLHGLAHFRKDPRGKCDCPACTSSRKPGDFGPWM